MVLQIPMVMLQIQTVIIVVPVAIRLYIMVSRVVFYTTSIEKILIHKTLLHFPVNESLSIMSSIQ